MGEASRRSHNGLAVGWGQFGDLRAACTLFPEPPARPRARSGGDYGGGGGESAGRRVKLNRYLSGLLVQFLGCDCGNDESGANC